MRMIELITQSFKLKLASEKRLQNNETDEKKINTEYTQKWRDDEKKQ